MNVIGTHAPREECAYIIEELPRALHMDRVPCIGDD
jgi:hypothetical protein